ncbi:Uncharacterized protein PBTT_05669 [Plasmodiophora brassicae]
MTSAGRSGHDEWHRSLRDVVGLLSSELDRDRDVVVSKDDVPWEVARSRIRPLEPFPVMKLKRDPHVTSTRRLSPAMELLVQLNDPTAVVPDLDESVRLALQAEIRQRRRAPALLVVQRVGAPLQMIQEDQREHRWWHDDQKHPLPRDMCSAPHWMAQFDYPNAATYVPVKRSSSAAPIRNRTVQ